MGINKKRTSALIGLGIVMVYFGLKLYKTPLDAYTWSELLINYAAGFIRRGLVGKIAYWVSPYMDAKFFLAAMMTFSYLICLGLYASLTKKINDYEWFLFLLAPSAFLFPIYDFEAFGRKDILLIVLILICYLLFEKKALQDIPCFIIFVLLFEIGIIIHEYMIFIFPPSLLLFLLCYRDSLSAKRASLYATIGFLLFVGNLGALYYLSRRYYDLDLMANSWIGLIENYNLTVHSAAFGWMGVSMKGGMQMVFDTLLYPSTFFSYLTGIALSFVPAWFLNQRYQIIPTIKQTFSGKKWFAWIWFIPFICYLPIFLFGADWGRINYISTFMFFCGLATLKESFACSDQGPDYSKKSGYERQIAILFMGLYFSTWIIKYFVIADHIALQQGLLFSIFGWMQ